MIQESCNNILKHAEANKITIQLVYEKTKLSASINDNGKGFDINEIEQNIAQKRSAGIKNIRNRAALMNATVEFNSSSFNGTEIQILIPIQNTNENREHSQSSIGR